MYYSLLHIMRLCWLSFILLKHHFFVESLQSCIDLPLYIPGLVTIQENTGFIKLYTEKGFFAKHAKYKHIFLTFQGNITRSYRITIMLPENSFPKHIYNSNYDQFGMTLQGGEKWTHFTSQDPLQKDMNIISSIICMKSNIIPSSTPLLSTQVAYIRRMLNGCPQTPILPHIGLTLQNFLSLHFAQCQEITTIKPTDLHWRMFDSFELLYLQPLLLIIDGRSDLLLFDDIVTKVDEFIAAHSVLEIAWEPYDASDPLVWILVPHSRSYPGYLFALLDTLQWRHPNVREADTYHKQKCTTATKNCVPGCPETKVRGIKPSGYGAATKFLTYEMLQGVVDWEAIQVSPVRLHQTSPLPPFWKHATGWTYTFGACPSHFLDCFFLPHSPCPSINIGANYDRGKLYFEKSRLQYNNQTYPFQHKPSTWRPSWWSAITGKHVRRNDLISLPSLQAAYSYLFRPKYSLRKEVHRRVVKFALQEPCAVLHIRRGDILLHAHNERGYLTFVDYIRASRFALTRLNVTTVFLVTDSARVLEEAQLCKETIPDLCGGLTFRYVEKARWRGAEGGFENHFPSGDASEELINIQLEFSLAQKCALAVTGTSDYARKIIQHMCCGFPLAMRGSLPQQCVCPPVIELGQTSFCRDRNDSSKMCDRGVQKMRQDATSRQQYLNFSSSDAAFQSSFSVRIFSLFRQKKYSSVSLLDTVSVRKMGVFFVKGLKDYCTRKIANNSPRTQYLCSRYLIGS